MDAGVQRTTTVDAVPTTGCLTVAVWPPVMPKCRPVTRQALGLCTSPTPHWTAENYSVDHATHSAETPATEMYAPVLVIVVIGQLAYWT